MSIIKIGDNVVSLGIEGPDRNGIVVPIPDDYSFASKDDPFKMARLVFVHYYDTQETVLIPESRLKLVYPSCCTDGICDCMF